MRISGLFLILVFGLLTVSCSKESSIDSVATISDDKLTEADFKAYLKLKRIPDEAGPRRERARKTFEDRNKLAHAIAREKSLKDSTIAAELRDYRNELLISRYFDAFLDKKISDEAVKSYFDENQKKYSRRKARVAHILFAIDPDGPEAKRNEKFKLAVDVHNKLKAGAKFEAMVKQYSDDVATKKRGGTVGWLDEASMEKPFADKVFSMKKDQISEPINTARGYHIIKLLDKPVTEKVEFDKEKGRIRYQLRYEAKLAEMKRLTGDSGASEPAK